MTKFASEFQESFVSLVDHFGESIEIDLDGTGASNRTVTAIVDREAGAIQDSFGNIVAYRLMIEVANDATTGIERSEIDDSVLKFVVARQLNGSATSQHAARFLSAEGGVCRFVVV